MLLVVYPGLIVENVVASSWQLLVVQTLLRHRCLARVNTGLWLVLRLLRLLVLILVLNWHLVLRLLRRLLLVDLLQARLEMTMNQADQTAEQ